MVWQERRQKMQRTNVLDVVPRTQVTPLGKTKVQQRLHEERGSPQRRPSNEGRYLNAHCLEQQRRQQRQQWQQQRAYSSWQETSAFLVRACCVSFVDGRGGTCALPARFVASLRSGRQSESTSHIAPSKKEKKKKWTKENEETFPFRVTPCQVSN